MTSDKAEQPGHPWWDRASPPREGPMCQSPIFLLSVMNRVPPGIIVGQASRLSPTIRSSTFRLPCNITTHSRPHRPKKSIKEAKDCQAQRITIMIGMVDNTANANYSISPKVCSVSTSLALRKRGRGEGANFPPPSGRGAGVRVLTSLALRERGRGEGCQPIRIYENRSNNP